MNIELHPDFKKKYKKRIAHDAKLTKKTGERIKLFQQNPQNPILKDHQLKGSKNQYRSFSITGDVRIVYRKSGDKIIFYDIGSHAQVYEK